MTTALQRFTHAIELNNLIYDLTIALEDAQHNPKFDGIAHKRVLLGEPLAEVERDLPLLRELLEQTVLSVVRDNLQPVDHAEFRKLFAGIAQIISDTRREALRSDSDSAEKLLRDLDKFEGLADAYERGIFQLIAEAQGAE